MVTAANESEFWPPIFSNPEFRAWAIRTLKRVPMAAGCSDDVMRRIFLFEGEPPSEWVSGLLFVANARITNSKPAHLVTQ